ncbi:MAG: hypothetical protein ABIP13_02410 [Tepidiformaceae bacterium]
MRYWLAAGIFLCAFLAFVVGIGWGVFGINPMLLAALAIATYVLAVAMDVLPPGRPDSMRNESADELAPSSPPLREQPHAAPLWHRESYEEDEEESPGAVAPGFGRSDRVSTLFTLFGGSLVAFGVALLVVGLTTRGNENPSSPLDRPGTAAATAPNTASATATPTPAPSTRAIATAVTPTVISAPPTATPAPPTPVPAPAPDTHSAAVEQQSATPLTGRWLLTDTVTAGPGAGEIYRFSVSVLEAGGQVTGGGDGLTISGRRFGTQVSVSFVRPGGSGEFNWSVGPDGRLIGTFSDAGAGNGGSSIGMRIS